MFYNNIFQYNKNSSIFQQYYSKVNTKSDKYYKYYKYYHHFQEDCISRVHK